MSENIANATHPIGMRSEIAAKWSKFSASDVAALKSKDDLVAQVQSKYQLDKAQAEKDVDAFAKGRAL
ncbi:hypothetical protein [Hyphomicrobium sp.]|jgi:hypothetical protein|uniref:hypothetical protein n=1 Tax=Hyphomicrobium sp. TaxID=82 RepID=UPI000FAC8908|nr:hypothetical protein [Hyphomicrobium sp.]RUO98138.1 MAG: hypothetical protein EKK30_15605 [Hyphomicrobium sp.]